MYGWSTITYSHGTFIAAGSEGYSMSTDKGTTWTTPTLFTDTSGNKLFISKICPIP